jgi:type I restriction-modification system DNA methylase subunit/restriction endonuclease S subunit
VFNQKIDFTRHSNKKAPCITLTEIQQMNQTKEQKTDNKTILSNIFRACLNILRDNEGLTGEKALRNMSYLLILKLLEPHFGSEIDIYNYEYDFASYFDENVIEYNKNRLLSIVRFSNLSNEKDDDIPNLLKYAWNIILSVHPTTKNIFLKDKGFDIKHQSTYKKLFDKLNTLPETDDDVLGDAYEEVIQDIMTGKVLGQFFTQPLIKLMMVKLIDPQIHPDGKIDTCCDPTMGTGGFLITYLQHILKQAKVKNIKPDWDFIKTEGLYGKELEPDTYQLAVSNMLISSGHMFEGLDCGDSIRVPILRKFDNILANPPFGIKGLKYDDFQSSLKNEYVPIKTDNAVSLFIQANIYMLKLNGKCAVVLPDGQDLFSKTNKTLIAVREYLMKTCDLKEIRYLPSGIFTYTSIKTCVFYFIKKREGTDVLETEIKYSKVNQKETARNYKFSKTHQTTNVKFYDYNPYEDIKNLLVEVPIEKIASNSYSLNYAEYMKDETEEEQYEDGVVVKTLGEVFHITKGSLQSSKNIEGEYEFITASDTNKTHNSFTNDCECVMLVGGAEGSLAKAQYFKGKFIASDLLYVLISKTQNEINYKYVWYYLNFNRKKHLLDNTICCGTPKKMISKDRCSNIKIPIPSLERQQEIVTYLDFIYEKANKTSNQKIAELKQLNEFCLNNQKIFGANVVKTLGEVCKVNQGTYIKPDMKIQGEYPVYGGGNASYYINQCNREDDIIIAKDGVSADCVRYEKKKFFLNHHGWTLICKEQIIKKYMFYYLQLIQPELLSIAKGTAQLGINQDNFYKVKIPIPSLERQQEIVEYCEYNAILIKQLEKEIKTNKQLAQQFITSFVKTQDQEELTEEPVEPIEDTVEDTVEPIEDTVETEEEQIEDAVKPIELTKEPVKQIMIEEGEEFMIQLKPKVKKIKRIKKIIVENA